VVLGEELAERVRARAHELGFEQVGIARADVPLELEHARYRAALEQGLHGPLDYLAANVATRARLDGPDILAGARSVIVVAARYDRPEAEPVPELARTIARYARGRDYHNYLRKKVRKLAAFVRSLGEAIEARPLSDTAPILERAWAARAGVGFVGKNGMVIAPGRGSYFLLAEVVTTLALAPDAPIEERCGRCTLCLDACPTQAFVAPFVLDAGACLSTATIELRGPIPVRLREGASHHLFGCDVCQEVCPFNGKERAPSALSARNAPHARWSELGLVDLDRLGMEGARPFAELVEGSPLHRATEEGLARNAALALAHVQGSDEALSDVAARHPSAVVRDAAEWALARRRR